MKTVPKIKSPQLYPYEPASDDLPVFPNGCAVWHTDCTCDERVPGRTMIDGQWVMVCMTCGSLRHYTGT